MYVCKLVVRLLACLNKITVSVLQKKMCVDWTTQVRSVSGEAIEDGRTSGWWYRNRASRQAVRYDVLTYVYLTLPLAQ